LAKQVATRFGKRAAARFGGRYFVLYNQWSKQCGARFEERPPKQCPARLRNGAQAVFKRAAACFQNGHGIVLAAVPQNGHRIVLTIDYKAQNNGLQNGRRPVFQNGSRPVLEAVFFSHIL
jgi:hypothetical protein